VTPRVLFAGRTRYRLPLSPGVSRKFAALERELELRVVGSEAPRSRGSDPRFSLAPPFPLRRLEGAAFWASFPVRIARELRRFGPDAVLAQSAYEAAAALAARRLARSDAAVVVDVHGDWRTATRLYGSRARRALAPLGDLVSRSALRRADAVRTVSPYTTALAREAGVEPTDVFPAFLDAEPFLAEPPAPVPEEPQALFVGVLERYKGIDRLAEAWRLAAPRVPRARLTIVGSGSREGVVRKLVSDVPAQTSWFPSLDADEIVRALDASTLLTLPSRSEGFGRVVVEAFCRGRPVVAARVGGIPDLVRDGENGLLVDPADVRELAGALVRVLDDRVLAARLGAAARAAVAEWVTTPEEYAARLRALVERTAPTLRA
jgi:glycogen synthase